MKAMKSAALAAVLMFATGQALAIDHVVDRLVHDMEEEVEALLEEIHAHYPNSHLDTDAHLVESELQAFHEHVAHGDSALQLRALLAPLGNAVVHLQQTANQYRAWHGGPWGVFGHWHDTLHPHVRREVNHVVNKYNQIRHRLYWHGHPHHHPHP